MYVYTCTHARHRFDDSKPPPQNQLYLAPCNVSNPFQQWSGETFTAAATETTATAATDASTASAQYIGTASAVINHGYQAHVVHQINAPGSASRAASADTGAAGVGDGDDTEICLGLSSCDPVEAEPCIPASSTAPLWLYNHSNHTISVIRPGASWSASACSHGAAGGCLDLNGGRGPDIDVWGCHPPSNPDYAHQRFAYDSVTKFIHPFASPTLDNSGGSGSRAGDDSTAAVKKGTAGNDGDSVDGGGSGRSRGRYGGVYSAAANTSMCLSLERGSPPPSGTLDPWGGR